MTAYRSFLSILSLSGLLLVFLPLSAAEPDNAARANDPKLQSHEAIKYMADELEADRKAREAAAKEKREMRQTEEPDSAKPTPDKRDSTRNTSRTTASPDAKSELKKLKEQCEEAREARIAPLRKEATQECIAKGVKTPEECERFYVDYGNAGTTRTGGFRQRMFHNIPECQPYYEAEKNRSSR